MDERLGKKAQDILEFKDPQYPQYPTEKNLELLKFIIEASSNKGDIVLDCFAGSGTSVIAAQMLGRNWIAIDQSELAIDVIKKRLLSISNDLFSKIEYDFLVNNSEIGGFLTTKKNKEKVNNLKNAKTRKNL